MAKTDHQYAVPSNFGNWRQEKERENQNPYSLFENCREIEAYMHRKFGAAALWYLFGHMDVTKASKVVQVDASYREKRGYDATQRDRKHLETSLSEAESLGIKGWADRSKLRGKSPPQSVLDQWAAWG